MRSNCFFTVATESELNELLAGREVGKAVEWEPEVRYRILPDTIGLLWTMQEEETIRPLVIVVSESGLRRLYGRYAQLRSDLSPLSPWCHVMGPEYFERMGSLRKDPDLDGLEAAWTGLAIAEAKLLADRPLTELRISACFATQSFVIARAKAVWYRVSVDDVLTKFDAAYRLVHVSTSNRQLFAGGRLRKSLEPIWNSLMALPGNDHVAPSLKPMVSSLRILLDVRSQRAGNEAALFSEPLIDAVPEAEELVDLGDLTAERRLELFDKFMSCLIDTDERKEPIRRASLPLIAGYLATVAAGGTPSLSLAEKLSSRWPEVAAWSYVLGGLGESVVWSSGFDGLGRLVARDLMRPFHLDESPICDFSLDEGQTLLDTKLSDPLVHLRLKQARLVSVSLMPGVNVLVPLRDATAIDTKKPRSRQSQPRTAPEMPPIAEQDFVDRLADAIVRRLENRTFSESKAKKSRQRKSKKKRSSQRDFLDN